MILANELRVGNWIQYNYPRKNTVFNKAKVFEIRNKGVVLKSKGLIKDYQDYIAFKHDTLKPIPLTEDILLKCGFDKHEYQYIIEYCINSFKLRYIKKNKKYVYHTGVRNIEKRYLHQLQNIYLDLEEKELEVNL